jgi:predicted HTH domain antitoxin
MIASTRGSWAVAQQRLRVEEAEKDCASVFVSLRAGDISLGEAGRLLAMAIGAAEDDVRQLDHFIAAGGAA